MDIKAKKKEEIFDAALACFNRHGYADTTLSLIAQRSGFSKGGIYHYFKSKRELFLELFRYRVRRYSEELAVILDREIPPEKRLRVFMEEAGRLLEQNEDFYRFCLEFLSMGARDGEIRKAVTAFYKDTVDIFSGFVNEGVDGGSFKPADPEKVARIIYFQVMGAFFTFFSVDPDFDFSDQISYQTEFMLNAMLLQKR